MTYLVKESTNAHEFFKPGEIVVDFSEWQRALSIKERMQFRLALTLQNNVTLNDLESLYFYGKDAAGVWHRIKKELCEEIKTADINAVTHSSELPDYNKERPTGRGARRRIAKAKRAAAKAARIKR